MEKVLRTFGLTDDDQVRLPSGRSESPASFPALQQVLVAVDFSNASLAALRLGLSLVRNTEITLRLLHVVETTGCAPATGPAKPAETITRWWEDSRARLGQLAWWLRSHHGNVATQIRLGLPSEQILKEAGDASLLLLGQRQPKRSRSWFAKHTIESVMEQSPCPVLLVAATGNDPGFVIPSECAPPGSGELARAAHATA